MENRNKSTSTETEDEELFSEDLRAGFTERVLDSQNTTKKYNLISDAKRQEIINALENGSVDRRSAAVLFNTNYHTICRIYRMYCSDNICVKGKQGGKRPLKLLNEHITFIKESLDEDCTISLKKLQELLMEIFNLKVSLPTIQKQISRFHYSFKRVSKVAESSISEEIKKRRNLYATWFLKVRNEQRSVVFFDETGFQVMMRNFYGRSIVGKKAVVSVPRIKSRNITVLASMNSKELVLYEILKGPCNRFHLLEYLKKLVLKLRQANLPNTIIVMDNASFHRCAEINEYVVQEGHQIEFLPAYSPFFNPIENMFSQWKKIVRNAGTRTEDELMNAIKSFETIVTTENCENYFRHVTNNCIDCINGEDVFDK